MPHVCVLGAGFVGLATAVRLQEEAKVGVTVVAKAFDQDTTSHGAGGLWKPYSLGGQQCNRSWIRQAESTRRVLHLCRGDPSRAGAEVGNGDIPAPAPNPLLP